MWHIILRKKTSNNTRGCIKTEMKNSKVVFLSLLLMGCASTKSFSYQHFIIKVNPTLNKNVCIDPTFDLEDRNDIISIIHEWNYALNGHAYLTVNNGECQIHINYLNIHDYATTTPLTLATSNSVGGNVVSVFRNNITSQTKLRAVMRHELGHILGSNHSEDNSGLMAQYYDTEKYQCIDQRTLDEVSRYQQFTCNGCNACIKEK